MTRHQRTDLSTDLRLTGPAALLEAIPYLLGFHPAASLVLVGLDERRLVVTARVDLTDCTEPTMVRETLSALCRGGAGSVVAVIYGDSGPPPGGELPWSAAAASVQAAAEAVGCLALEVLLVADGRWWSYTCGSDACCPAEGRPLPEGTSAVSAAATYAGMVALPDREALAATLDPRPDAEREALLPLIEQAEHAAVQAVLDGRAARHDRSVKRALFAAARAAGAGRESGRWLLSDRDAARFGVALSAITERDAVWMAVDDGRLDGGPFWLELARRLPSPYDAAPLFLFAWGAWRSGNGTLAGIAAERAIASDPGYSAADLLRAALARGVDPRRLPKLRSPRSA